MILSPKIAAALDGPDAGTLPCVVPIEDGGNRLVLHLTASGPVGLAFSALDFATTARPEWTPESLKAWGDRIAARVTYLMEPRPDDPGQPPRLLRGPDRPSGGLAPRPGLLR